MRFNTQPSLVLLTAALLCCRTKLIDLTFGPFSNPVSSLQGVTASPRIKLELTGTFGQAGKPVHIMVDVIMFLVSRLLQI